MNTQLRKLIGYYYVHALDDDCISRRLLRKKGRPSRIPDWYSDQLEAETVQFKYTMRIVIP